MRVLLDISPITGVAISRTGLARVAYSIAHALSAQNDVDLECVGWGSVAATFEVRRFIAEQSVLKSAPVKPARITEIYDRLYQRYSHPPRLLIRVGQVLNKTRNPLRGLDPARYDAVHSIYAGFPRVLRKWNKPLVLTVHDINALRLPSHLVHGGQVAITRRILGTVRSGDWVVCISRHTLSDFLDYNKHIPSRTCVIPNGVDTNLFVPVTDKNRLETVKVRYKLPDGKYVLTLSSLAPHKNLKFLLEAWANVPSRKVCDWLVVAGGKSYGIQRLVSDLGIKSELLRQVILTGFVPDEDLASLISGAQCFVFPSLYEGFGLPVLEAMACGCPVISSNAASLPEVVGNAGVLCDPTDRALWATSLANELNKPLRTAPDEASLHHSEKFSWSAVAESYTQLYKRLCSA